MDFDLPVCKVTRKIKGFATITFQNPQCAVVAMNELDGTDLLGRLMHILPALSDEQVEEQKSWMSIYQQNKEKERVETSASGHNWNTLFLSSSAVADILAKKFKKSKQEVLNMETSSPAVVLALAETEIVRETKKFLEDNGVSVDAFTDPTVERSDTVLLVKNLPADTKASDIVELFGKWGELGRVVLPPSGTTCIVEFLTATEAKKARRNMDFKKFGHNPLYVEKAPVKTFTEEYKKPEPKREATEKRKRNNDDDDDEEISEKKTKIANEISDDQERSPEDHTTVYVQNLPLEINEEDIHKHFSNAGEVYSVVIAKKGTQSRGYGFVQYYRQKDARSALISLENSTLHGRNLSLRLSEKKLTSAGNTKRKLHDFGEQKSNKISVKNISFQVTKKEISDLFKPFGQISRVFLAKHHTLQFNNGGYGFVEYIRPADAKRALETMGLSTHLQGRRLVLQWAKEDETLDEIRQKTAQKRDIIESFSSGHKKLRHAIQNNDEEDD